MVSKLDNISGLKEPKEYEIGGIKLMIYPLSTRNFSAFLKMSKEDKPEIQAEGFHEITDWVLQKADPESMDKEAREIFGMRHSGEIIQATLEVSKLSIPKKE